MDIDPSGFLWAHTISSVGNDEVELLLLEWLHI
jgi:hypothetical protein